MVCVINTGAFGGIGLGITTSCFGEGGVSGGIGLGMLAPSVNGQGQRIALIGDSYQKFLGYSPSGAPNYETLYRITVLGNTNYVGNTIEFFRSYWWIVAIIILGIALAIAL